MNYIDNIAADIGARCGLHMDQPDERRLLRLYAVLALSKGIATTDKDVHDAWCAWRCESQPDHRSLRPFEMLPPDVQDLDKPYTSAIHSAAILHQSDRIDRLLAVDAILLKASGISQEGLYANLENRLNQLILSAFSARAEGAVSSALRAYMRGANVNAVIAATRSIDGWEAGIKAAIRSTTRNGYTEGKRGVLRRAGRKPVVRKAEVSIEPSFTLRDEQAIKQLVDGQLHWVGEYYDSELSERIDSTIRETMLESGMGRAEAGQILEGKLRGLLGIAGADIPATWLGGVTRYFKLIAANTVVNARTRGALGQMAEIGVTEYVINAVGDERSCDRCKSLDGKVVKVERAVEILNAINGAATPEEVKQLHPWASRKEDIERNPDKFLFPPFHGECRCTIDIAETSEITFEPVDGL